jgi:hypothetical protein
LQFSAKFIAVFRTINHSFWQGRLPKSAMEINSVFEYRKIKVKFLKQPFMFSKIWLFNKPLNLRLVASCFLSFWLLLTPIALAGYQPSRAQKPAPKDTRSDAGTTRGCKGSGLPLTALASRNYVGQTTSTHPTFAWFVPDAKPLPMEFILYELDANGNYQTIYQTRLQSSPGIMQLSLPQAQPGLQIGKQYLWQVVIFCAPAQPSSALSARGSLEVVPISSELRQKLDKTVNIAQKANLYAEAGFWYDALGEALQLAPESKLGEVGSNLLQDLINGEKLAIRTELDPKEQIAAQKQVETLEKILNLESEKKMGEITYVLCQHNSHPAWLVTVAPKEKSTVAKLLRHRMPQFLNITKLSHLDYSKVAECQLVQRVHLLGLTSYKRD